MTHLNQQEITVIKHDSLVFTSADMGAETCKAEEAARSLHARMLAEATATIELTMGLPLSDAAALDLLLIGVAATSTEEVAALVHGIVGDEVADEVFADIVDRLTPAA